MMWHAGNYATVATKLRRVRVVVASRRNKEYLVSSALEKERNHVERGSFHSHTLDSIPCSVIVRFSPTSKADGRGAQHIRR
jgi:hypothetical protein